MRKPRLVPVPVSWLIACAIISLFAVVAFGADTEVPYVKNKDGSVTIHMSAEHVKMCESQGGCTIITMSQMAKALHDARTAKYPGAS